MRKKSTRTLLLLCLSLAIQQSHVLASSAKEDAAKKHEIQEQAQKGYTVKGTVKDQYGDPLGGVSIIVKGTTIGTSSDMDGNFTLNVPEKKTTLAFSFIGFMTKDMALNGQNDLMIVLSEDTELLDEVVVVGYGSMKKSEISTSVASLKPTDFNLGGARDPMSVLEGKIAGLSITRKDGVNPNAGVAMQLRGVTSLTGDKSPLMVIDGIPGGNTDLLQPDDIESIEVLKDGSAAAIYGSRANAGVILVTTKSGKKGSTQVEYSTYFTHHYVAERADFMDAAEYRAYKNDPTNPKGGQMTDYGHTTDFFDQIINKSNLSQNHNLAVSGGSENANYRASLFYNNFEGIGLHNSRRNYGGRVAINAKGWEDMLALQMNIATNFNDADMLGGQWESALTRNPTAPIYNEDGTYFETEKETNPVGFFNQRTQTRDQQTTSANAKAVLTPIKDLNFSVFGSIQKNSYMDNEYKEKNSKESIDSYEGGGYAKKHSYSQTSFAIEPTIDYSLKVLEDHNFNALVGYSYQYKFHELMEMENMGFLSDATSSNNMGAGSWLTRGDAKMKSEKKDETLIAFFGRLNYSYKGKYVAQASLRREGSSKFGDNHKWGNFPAFSAAWNISNEDFMQNISYLSSLKLRAGYGVTGNSGIDPYKSKVFLGTGGAYIQDGQWLETYGPTSNPNPNLRWEKKKEWNVGIDFGFFNNRLGGSIDLFDRRTSDLLESYSTQLPPFIQDQIYTNVGEISSKGIELTLNTTPLVLKNFTWKSDLTFSTTSNKLVSFSNDVYSIEYKEYGDIGGYGQLGNAIRTYEGDNIGNFYGKRFAGLDAEGKWLFYKKDGSKVPAADIKQDDLSVIGNGVPKFYASWSNYLKYKDFDFSLSFRGKFGFDVLNIMEIAYGNKISLPTNVLNSATTTHKELNDTYQYSDYYIENASFVKLDNITVGYTFKKRASLKLMPQFRVYVTARDLLTITGYKGVNPEVDDTGLAPGMGSRDPYPTTTSLTVGLNVQF